ncbi:hypothetical protein GGI07_000548 [Coemansia sp. Benny D115]|nr:hypothetical protein GGI07_000548 [Coemansia sp. Benny D115]
MEDQSKTPAAGGRYSLRTRTPVKPVAPPPAPVTPTSARKRGRAATSKQTQQAPPRARRRATSIPAPTKSAPPPPTARRRSTARGRITVQEDIVDETPDAAELSSEDEAYSPNEQDENTVKKASPPSTPLRRGPGRPRKDGLVSARKTPRHSRGDLHPGDSSATPSRKSFDLRRVPVHLTKHDPFKTENLEAAINIMQSVPVNTTANDDRYELMKMSDALKMCGYELAELEGIENNLFNEIYRMLSWAVHAAGPNGPTHPEPPMSEEARTVLLRVFSSLGRRIREETKDMAGYHRRHALRKLLLAGRMDSSVKDAVVHRRNPLRIPGPLVDIWREPYKKTNDGNESPGSDA